MKIRDAIIGKLLDCDGNLDIFWHYVNRIGYPAAVRLHCRFMKLSYDVKDEIITPEKAVAYVDGYFGKDFPELVREFKAILAGEVL